MKISLLKDRYSRASYKSGNKPIAFTQTFLSLKKGAKETMEREKNIIHNTPDNSLYSKGFEAQFSK